MKSSSQSTIPKVFIVMDTISIGGPGRGLFHFLDSVDHTTFDYLICTFRHRSSQSTEFIDACNKRGYNVTVLPQNGLTDSTVIGKVEAAFRNYGGNILQTHGYKGHVLGYLLRRRLRVPWVAFSHGWTSENWKVRFYNAIGRWCMIRADSIIAVSSPLAEEVAQATNRKREAILLPNAIQVKNLPPLNGGSRVREQLSIPSSACVLGCIGRLSPEKGQENLIRAVAALPHQSLHLLLVGDGPQRSELVHLSHSLGLASRVHFSGYTSDTAAYYDAVDFVVIPSLSEGLPNVLLESLAYQKVVMATPVGEIPLVLTHKVSGYLSRSTSIEDLTCCLKDLLCDTSLYTAIRKAAYDLVVTSFSAEARAAKLLDVYRALI